MEVENAEGMGAEGTQRLETIAAGDMEERERKIMGGMQWWGLLPMPVVVAAGDNSNDNLPGHGGGTIAVQHDFPVVLAMREYCVGTHTHPECIFSNADSVAIVADVSLRMLQISIPEEGCVCVWR